MLSAALGEVDFQRSPVVCANPACGKILPPAYKRPWKLRGSDLCKRCADFRSRSDRARTEAKRYAETYQAELASLEEIMREPEHIYVRDAGRGPIRKFRASYLLRRLAE